MHARSQKRRGRRICMMRTTVFDNTTSCLVFQKFIDSYYVALLRKRGADRLPAASAPYVKKRPLASAIPAITCSGRSRLPGCFLWTSFTFLQGKTIPISKYVCTVGLSKPENFTRRGGRPQEKLKQLVDRGRHRSSFWACTGMLLQ